jgi:predicted ATPase
MVKEPVIRKLIIQGFRSFRSEVVEFDNPTVLVGQNGSGKSNLIDALAFLSEAMRMPLTDLISRRGGGRVVCHGSSASPQEGDQRIVAIGVALGALSHEIAGARYAFQIGVVGRDQSDYGVLREQCVVEYRDGHQDWFERLPDRPFRSNIDGLKPRLADEWLALPMVGGDARFTPVLRVLENVRDYSIDPDRMRDWRAPDSGRILNQDGSNTASVLREIGDREPDDLQRICELMEPIVPMLTHVDVKDYGSRLALEFTQRWGDGARSLTLDASSLSDGALRALGLFAAVYQRQTPSLMTVEEPETSIHPGAIGLILDVLDFASERTQLIITTHSPEALDAEWLEDRHLRIVTWEDGETRVSPLAAWSCEALREHLMSTGELFRSHALEGMPPGPEMHQPAELFADLAV